MDGWNEDFFSLGKRNKHVFFSTMYPYGHRVDISENVDF